MTSFNPSNQRLPVTDELAGMALLAARAVRYRDAISVAKGLLMGRYAIDGHSALRLLVARSERDGITVADAARSVVEAVVRRRR